MLIVPSRAVIKYTYRGETMNGIKQFIDGDILSQIMALPKHLQDQKLEVIVLPASESEDVATDVSKRFGFMEGKFTVPEDFDRMGEDEILEMFKVKNLLQ